MYFVIEITAVIRYVVPYFACLLCLLLGGLHSRTTLASSSQGPRFESRQSQSVQTTFSITTLSIRIKKSDTQHNAYAKYCYAECHLCN